MEHPSSQVEASKSGPHTITCVPHVPLHSGGSACTRGPLGPRSQSPSPCPCSRCCHYTHQLTRLSFSFPSSSTANCKQVVTRHKEQKVLRACDLSSRAEEWLPLVSGLLEVSQPQVSSLLFYPTEHTVKAKQDLPRHQRLVPRQERSPCARLIPAMLQMCSLFLS